MNRDNAIRKVQGLQAVALGEGYEAETASAMARKLIEKYEITIEELADEDPPPGLFDGVFDGLYESFGFSKADIKRMKRDSHSRWEKFDRLRRDGVTAIYRMQAFLAEEGNEHFRSMDDVYKTIDKQLALAKGQLKQCGWCHDRGFGPEGSTQRYALGKTKTGRDRYNDYHPACWKKIQEMIEKQEEGEG